MFKVFKNLIEERKSELTMTLSIMGICWVAGAVLLFVMLKTESESTTFHISTALSMMIIGFMTVLFGAYAYVHEFNLVVGMGIPRKRFIPGFVGVSVVFVSIYVVILYAGYFLEDWILTTFYSGFEKETGVGIIISPRYVIPVAVGIVAVQFFVGSMLMKFGKKAFWVVWAIWMIVCLAPGRIEKAAKADVNSWAGKFQASFLDVVNNMGVNLIMILIVVVACLLLLGGYFIARKQQVSEI